MSTCRAFGVHAVMMQHAHRRCKRRVLGGREGIFASVLMWIGLGLGLGKAQCGAGCGVSWASSLVEALACGIAKAVRGS